MDTRLLDEKSPLINSSYIIQTSDDEEDRISLLHQDIINVIASYLSYSKLANLRKTSSQMNQLVENTPAGQLAREANNLQPCNF